MTLEELEFKYKLRKNVDEDFEDSLEIWLKIDFLIFLDTYLVFN